MNNVLLGIIAMSNFVACLFFFKFWKSTHDRFFLFFAAAFGIETFDRMGQAMTHSKLEDFPSFYLMRLFAFGLILTAIFYKNKARKR